MTFTLGAQLAQIKSSRASVLPYIVKNNDGRKKIYFLLGIDKESGDITDLGGGVKRDEFSLEAGLREFREESDEIFGNIYDHPNDYMRNIALSSHDMCVLFVPLAAEWYDKAAPLFEQRKGDPFPSIDGTNKKKSHCEIERLVWIDEDSFLELIGSRTGSCKLPDICDRQIWSRLQKFYRRKINKDLKEALKMRYYEDIPVWTAA
uniref:NUDIX hydrolase n=1 Tax=Marseillevirus LCMAC101 TaxID=2506602 RepID=A0A481YQU9_9VIRU|nr:MAG: NUDIX hydrolase [Marseillevirus LCMAC101]